LKETGELNLCPYGNKIIVGDGGIEYANGAPFNALAVYDVDGNRLL
jgi:hypothetical protein